MAIPDFQTIMLPLLRLAADGQEHKLGDAYDELAREFGLSPDERSELLPSGRQRKFDNRVGWARTHLRKAGLFGSPRRWWFVITPRGRDTLAENPPHVDMQYLTRFEEFRAFRETVRVPSSSNDDEVSERTPRELLEAGIRSLREAAVSDLLERVRAMKPRAFERLVLDVLVAMGYGADRVGAARHLGQSGDEGVDGVIAQDSLGLDVVYVQAKRWNSAVGRPDVQQFIGSLDGKNATKGVFLTTSTFSAEASDYVNRISPKRIVLVDGQRLAELMVDHGVGVTNETLLVSRISSDYFDALDEGSA